MQASAVAAAGDICDVSLKKSLVIGSGYLLVLFWGCSSLLPFCRVGPGLHIQYRHFHFDVKEVDRKVRVKYIFCKEIVSSDNGLCPGAALRLISIWVLLCIVSS
jgi:hypothetical protein